MTASMLDLWDGAEHVCCNPLGKSLDDNDDDDGGDSLSISTCIELIKSHIPLTVLEAGVL